MLLVHKFFVLGVLVHCMLVRGGLVVFLSKAHEFILLSAKKLLLAFAGLFDWSDGSDPADLSDVWGDGFVTC